MGKQNVPQPFHIDKVSLGDWFTAPSPRHFVELIIGWVLTVGVYAISRVTFTAGLRESESLGSIYRFLQKAEWAPNRVLFRSSGPL